MFPLLASEVGKSAENREWHPCWLTSSGNLPLPLSLSEGNASLFFACRWFSRQQIFLL